MNAIKKNLFILILIVLANGCADTSSTVEDLIALGTNEYSKDAWAKANQEERATMVYSFLKNHNITTMTYDDMVNLLGKSTGYYNYDSFPAYLVGPKTVKSEYGQGYLLAFPTDDETGKIKGYRLIPDIPKK